MSAVIHATFSETEKKIQNEKQSRDNQKGNAKLLLKWNDKKKKRVDFFFLINIVGPSRGKPSDDKTGG